MHELQRTGARQAVAGRQRKLDPRAAAGPGRYRELYPGVHIRVHRVFSRDMPREVLNYRLDLGVISYLPEERELTARGILSR